MQNSAHPQGSLARALVLATPGVCTVAAAACVFFFRSAPPAWHPEMLEHIAGTVLVSLSSVGFLAICKYAGTK